MQTKPQLRFVSEKLCLNGQLPYQLQDEKRHTVILSPKESADQRTVIYALEHMT